MKFDVQKTNMVKCIAIILMLWHHLFGCVPAFCEQYGTESLLFEWNTIYRFGLSAKICVGIYVFLTAYGITYSYNQKFPEEKLADKKAMEKFCFNRYIKLAINFLIVFALALLTSFLRDGGVRAVYMSNGWKKGVMYAAFDALGVANYFGTPSMNETWWYMSIAIYMIFVIPLLVKLYKQIGRGLIVVGIFVFHLGINASPFIQYVMCMIVGIWCAEESILEKMWDVKICEKKFINGFIKEIFYLLTFIFLIYAREKTGYSYWIDAIVPIVCCEFCMELYAVCPITERIMGFVGKHSMNIFLIHTLIFEYYFTSFIYGFKNWLLVLIALLLTSLVSSIVIERIKANIFIRFCRKE